MPGKQMTVEEYYDVLETYSTRRGLIFNPDDEIVMPLLKGLLANKSRYGHASCPCRLACGEREKDQDVICPCVYADPDLREYGKCYCELYVSQDYLDEKIDRTLHVPERRPAEKMCW
jgi:ferredoxin-thioredoxin reductase catalytic subunit